MKTGVSSGAGVFVQLESLHNFVFPCGTFSRDHGRRVDSDRGADVTPDRRPKILRCCSQWGLSGFPPARTAQWAPHFHTDAHEEILNVFRGDIINFVNVLKEK